MQISSIFGLIFSLVVFLGSIRMATEQWQIFIDLPSVLIVAGGVFATSFMSFRGRYVFRSIWAGLKTIKKQRITPQSLCDDVKQFVAWARIFNRAGVEGLHAVTEGDPFLERCVYLAKQEYAEADFRLMIEDFIEQDYYRNLVTANILNRMGAIAPAFGMVGTLIGLIIMLGSMGKNPGGIGTGMAVALITTLYGVIMAKMFFEPFAGKIKEILGIERFRRMLLLDGFSMLLARKDPYYIMDRLNCKLDPRYIYDFEKERSQEKGDTGKGKSDAGKKDQAEE